MPMKVKAAQTETLTPTSEDESWTIEEVIRTANGLPLTSFFRLRDALDEIEERKWHEFLTQLPRRNRPQGITDEMVDAVIIRNRRKTRRDHRQAAFSDTPE